jgi:uncharacterized protein YegP (UPF0339 family)
MKKVPCVEFYATRGFVTDKFIGFGWRLRAKNGQPILSPHETFVSHRNAVDSFKRVCDALDARGPWQIKDLEGVTGSHAMLIA